MTARCIARIESHPLRVTLAKAQRTSQGDFPAIEIVVVEVTTSDGLVGVGEALARRGAAGYARLIDEVLTPRLLGKDPADRRAHWKAMRGALTGRPGGQLVEAISAIDIALWDIAGKAAGVPIHKLLGGIGRTDVAAYASSINWLDDTTVEAEVTAALQAGFREIKVKLGHPLKDAVARAKFIRKLAGDDIALYVDANWAYDVDDAMVVGKALCDLGYGFFEEPILPHDRDGYRRLAQHLPIRLAAGESDYVASEALNMLQDRSIGLIQPDVTRSGRHHRDLAHRRTRCELQHRLRPACRLVGRDLRRRQPAARGGSRDLPHLRVHGLCEPAARRLHAAGSGRGLSAGGWQARRAAGSGAGDRDRSRRAQALPDRVRRAMDSSTTSCSNLRRHPGQAAQPRRSGIHHKARRRSRMDPGSALRLPGMTARLIARVGNP
ncbi:mandelate racemase/muconate lactonizing enzyme family protein [Bosea sp. PAMC 26642]|uniref:mandelate racemase/muconate lactonizing enzyme family protein n=1 Tax=Bosea sp. (strain PAMC 26642) TaxID=1792307 RepID=UPI000AA4B53F